MLGIYCTNIPGAGSICLFFEYLLCRAALLAVFATQSLLLAFALKMKVAAALKGATGSRPSASSVGYVGAGYAERAVDFLGACLPSTGSSAPLHRIARLKVQPKNCLATCTKSNHISPPC